MKTKAILFYAAALLVIGSVFAWFVFFAWGGKDDNREELYPSTVLARVDGVDILAEDVNRMLNFSGLGGETADRAEQRRKQRNALDTLINRQLLMNEARRRKIEVSDEELESRLGRFFEMRGGKENVLKQLEESNLSVEDVKDDIRLGVLYERIEKEVRGELSREIRVARDEVERYYEENKDNGRITKMEIDFIFVEAGDGEDGLEEARNLAEEIISLLDQGEPFDEVTKRFSGDSASRVKTGHFTEDDQVSEILWQKPISFVNGFQILRCASRRVVPLDDVEDEINNYLRTVKLREAVDEYFSGLRERADVEVFLK